MVNRNDLLLILGEMEEKGIDTSKYKTKLFLTEGISMETLKFINDKRQLDVAAFYEMLRKNYNAKKSPLYKNIVRDEVSTPEDVLTTLSALNLQILLYARKLDDAKMFLSHSRGEEITWALNNYYKTYDLIPCYKLLKLLKSDLKCFESIK